MSTLLATNNNDCHQSGEYAANHIDDGQQMLQDNHRKDSLEVASRKLAAAELRRARKAARENPRIRLFSDSSDELPKGILKNARIPPTKRSVSECVDDLSQIMADLNLNIHDLSKAACLHHQYFKEEDEVDEEEEEEEYGNNGDDDESDELGKENSIASSNNNSNGKKNCDCNKYGDKGDTNNDDANGQEKPKKSVRFDDKVYETVFFASRLYDRRSFNKYHLSSRHHPPISQNKSKNKNNRQRSKSESDDDSHSISFANLKMDNGCCKLSKSQRSKQSKKDKKKRLNAKRDSSSSEASNSEDQGYHSHTCSFSD